MSIIDYAVGNLGIVICDAPTIYFYSSISDISNVGNSTDVLGDWYYVILSVSITVTILVVIAVFYYTRRELKKTLSQIEAKSKWLDPQKDESEEEGVGEGENNNNEEEHVEERDIENTPNQPSQSDTQGKSPNTQTPKVQPVSGEVVA